MFSLNAFQTAYLLDIAIIVILLVGALRDAKSGFITCIFGLIISIVSLVVAFFCAATVVEATGGLFGLGDVICSAIEESLLGIVGFDADVSEEGLIAALEGASFPPFLAELIASNGVEAPAGTTLAAHISVTVGGFVTLVLTGILLFLVCKIVLTLVEKIFTTLVSKIAFLGVVNTILGALIGLIKGAITVCLIFSVLALFTSPQISEFVNQSIFAHFIYNENPINYIFSLIFVG